MLFKFFKPSLQQLNQKFIFTIDVKSLYIVDPHLRALKLFLDKRANKKPFTSVFI